MGYLGTGSERAGNRQAFCLPLPRHFSTLLALGGLMCVLSAYLVKLSNVHGKAGSAVAGRDGVGLGALRHPRPGVWAVGAAALVALGISFFYLHQDAVRGYHEILPVYAFTALVLICAVIWGYLISKLMQKH